MPCHSNVERTVGDQPRKKKSYFSHLRIRAVVENAATVTGEFMALLRPAKGMIAYLTLKRNGDHRLMIKMKAD